MRRCTRTRTIDGRGIYYIIKVGDLENIRRDLINLTIFKRLFDYAYLRSGARTY